MKKLKIAALLPLICIMAVWLSGCGGSLDITRMNNQTANAQVQNINSNPASFEGRTIKIRGTYSVSGNTRYVALPTDSCCPPQRLRFQFSGTLPAANSTITVEGTFTKSQNGSSYFIDASRVIR